MLYYMLSIQHRDWRVVSIEYIKQVGVIIMPGGHAGPHDSSPVL